MTENSPAGRRRVEVPRAACLWLEPSQSDRLLLQMRHISASCQRKIKAAGLFAAVGLFAAILSSISMAHPNPAPPQTAKSIRSPHDVALNLNPDSPFWRDGSSIVFDGDRYGRSMKQFRTEVRSRWTDSSLYLLFVCPYETLNLKPSPETTTETNQLWNWDVAEIFIGSDFQHIRRYKEFELSPQGEWVDLDIDLDQPHPESGWTWKSGFETAARIDPEKKIWYGAMRIPFAAIGPEPHVGNKFRVNFFRAQGESSNRQLLAWQAPMGESFHVPERFGVLELR
jgi:Carbohydrate family 9 binding domain-like